MSSSVHSTQDFKSEELVSINLPEKWLIFNESTWTWQNKHIYVKSTRKEKMSRFLYFKGSCLKLYFVLDRQGEGKLWLTWSNMTESNSDRDKTRHVKPNNTMFSSFLSLFHSETVNSSCGQSVVSNTVSKVKNKLSTLTVFFFLLFLMFFDHYQNIKGFQKITCQSHS